VVSSRPALSSIADDDDDDIFKVAQATACDCERVLLFILLAVAHVFDRLSRRNRKRRQVSQSSAVIQIVNNDFVYFANASCVCV
jgi:hypothetical protein